MKETILLAIYDAFDRWSKPIPRCCSKGCSTCCTQDITITALEGERILDFICRQKKEQWFASCLQAADPPPPPSLTSNEYAAACFQQSEIPEDSEPNHPTPCPFLESDCCSIYPVRPFACRCFLSGEPCNTQGAAIIPNFYVSAATVMTQLIEHLCQKEYWGNMFDVLPSLLDISKFHTLKDLLPENAIIVKARLKVRKAMPLPGFLLLEEEQQKISPLIDGILSHQVEGRSIRDILNGV